jgi:hypothetical protein
MAIIRKRIERKELLQLALVGILLLVGFAVRMVNLYDPPLDFHPVRQLRSALIARGVYYDLNPAADPATRSQAAALVPVDVHEPPIYEEFMGLVYLVTGGERVWVARIFSSLFWLVGALALYAIARRFVSFWAAALGLAFYLFLPFSIVASRIFQPDPWMVMWILLAAWAMLRWSETPTWKWSVAAALLGGLAILVKVTAGFFVAGFMILLTVHTLGWKEIFGRGALKPWGMALLTLAPAVIYYLGLHSGRAAEYFTYNTLEMMGMVLTSKFYAQWLALVNSLFGLTVVLAALLGTVLASPRLRLLLVGLWLGYAAYGLTWPYQYTTHEYYHLSLVALVGLGIVPLIESVLIQLNRQGRVWRLAAAVLLLAAIGYQGWVGRSVLVAENHSLEPRSWELVGQAIPKNESFVALTSDYGLRLSYYGWRSAAYYWPAQADLEVARLRGQTRLDTLAFFKEMTQGKNYFLVTALNDFDAQPELKTILTEHYPLFHQGSGFMVYDLVHPISAP